MVNALVTNNSPKPAINNVQSQPTHDPRPHTPPCSTTDRRERIDNGYCVRCGSSPSNPWGNCKYKNFKDDPMKPRARFSGKA
jgi:hypothetical protein